MAELPRVALRIATPQGEYVATAGQLVRMAEAVALVLRVLGGTVVETRKVTNGTDH